MIALVALALGAAAPCPGLAKPFAGHCVEPEQAVMDVNRCPGGVIEWKIGMRTPGCVPCNARRPTPAELSMCPEALRQASANQVNDAVAELRAKFPGHAAELEEEQRVWELKRDGTCNSGDGDGAGSQSRCQDAFNRKRLTELDAHRSEYAKTEKPARKPQLAKRLKGKRKRG